MKFKKKLTEKETDVLLHDLECLYLKADENNNYHYNLLRKNILDLGGRIIKFKCEVCGFECKEIPKFKKNECPLAIQHYFSEVKDE